MKQNYIKPTTMVFFTQVGCALMEGSPVHRAVTGRPINTDLDGMKAVNANVLDGVTFDHYSGHGAGEGGSGNRAKGDWSLWED